jgi:excinuclease UvrABC nuclease subunit
VPITNPLYRFTEVIIAGAPDNAGIYALWQDDELIYVGRAMAAGTIRERLAEHFHRRLCPCTEKATHYSWELSLRPAAREAELLQEYEAKHGKLPRCNAEAA